MQQPEQWRSRYNIAPLKARGNLSYQDFLRLLEKLWTDSHPGIPLMANANKSFGQYPVLVYRLDLRKPHPAEPKPRYREELVPVDKSDNTRVIISAQRFQSVITFTVITQQDPHTAETLIEVFEDFMLEFQPVFKELGVSELVYVRRLPDSADSRPGEGIVSRSVSYLLTTEKLIFTELQALERIAINARVFLRETDCQIFIADPTNGTIAVRGASFTVGDYVMIIGGQDAQLPSEIYPGIYYISNLVLTPLSREYELSYVRYLDATPSFTPITNLSPGRGYIRQVDGDIDIRQYLEDDFQALATPNF